MKIGRFVLVTPLVATAVLCGLLSVLAIPAHGATPSEEVITREIRKGPNKALIEEFIVRELDEVNEIVVKPLLPRHPSLQFFINQAAKGPLNSLYFLEQQVYKLREAQENMDSLPYLVIFTPSEKKILLGLRSVAKRFVSYGIPITKRDFYRVLMAIRKLAKQRGANPIALIQDPKFRDAVYRECAPTAAILDREMGELSYGESVSMKLGWTLEKVTVTRLWMIFQGNRLPTPEDYEVFRKKRSEYFKKRLKRIYGRGLS